MVERVHFAVCNCGAALIYAHRASVGEYRLHAVSTDRHTYSLAWLHVLTSESHLSEAQLLFV